MKTFAEFQEGVASLAVKKGSKVVPALMTGIGAAGMIMQSRKKKETTDDEDAENLFSEVEKMLKNKNPSTGNRSRAERRIAELKDKLRRNADKRRMEKSYKKPASDKLDEGVTALAVGGSKVVPALMTGIGAVGTIMQARRKNKKRKIPRAEQRLRDRENNVRDNDMIIAKPGEAKKQNKLIDKYIQTRKEEVMAAPTNNASSGAIAGLPPDNPPVKRKKRYIYGGTGSRKIWMNNK